jgi:hypothetical protein
MRMRDMGMPRPGILVQLSRHTHDKFAGPIVSQVHSQPDASFSTVPPDRDVNPYGVAIVPSDFPGKGKVHPGDVPVSNSSDSDNVQGTGTTIIDISPSGTQSIFFQDLGLSGLTTTLGVLQLVSSSSATPREPSTTRATWCRRELDRS